MKKLTPTLLSIGLSLVLAAPVLAGDRHRDHNERHFDRHQQHAYSDRHKKRHYRQYRQQHHDHHRYSHNRHRHYHQSKHNHDYIKWIGGAILLNELIHLHGNRVCYDRHYH